MGVSHLILAQAVGFSVVGYVMGLVISAIVFSVVGGIIFFKIFEKAHVPIVNAFIPFYNIALAFKLSGKNPNLAGLIVAAALIGGLPIPLAGLIGFGLSVAGWILLGISVGNAFGKSTGFIVGLCIPLVNLVFYLILGFGPSQYQAAPAIAPVV